MSRSQYGTGFFTTFVLRLALVFVVFAEICYLANTYSARSDLTGDQLYTLTASTQNILDRLEDNLVIEAYFSPKDGLPILMQPQRQTLTNTLDEYVALGRGRVQLVLINPLADRDNREKAERLGIIPQGLTQAGEGSMTAMELWQGLRIRYGGRKQKVIPQFKMLSTGQFERMITPAIKLLLLETRPRIGVLSFASTPGANLAPILGEVRTPPKGYRRLLQSFGDEYELVTLDVSKGQLVPETIGTALLISPKGLTDRVKYVFDQFLMRGGRLVVFVDGSDIEVRADRVLRGIPVAHDAPGSKVSFLGMLNSYGASVLPGIVGEGVAEMQQAYGQVQVMAQTMQPTPRQIPNPYIFHARPDWSEVAGFMAQGNPVLAQTFAAAIKPGIDTSHDLMASIASIPPGLFWPCPVNLAAEDDIPEGVTGQVLMRTSPLSWTDRVPARPDEFDPFGEAPPQFRANYIQRWVTKMQNKRPTIPVQVPLMVYLKGTFTSAFAGLGAPPKPQAEVAPVAKPTDDWFPGADRGTGGGIGPVLPGDQPTGEAAEPRLEKAPETADLLVIGDATFLRDDFYGYDYMRQVPIAAGVSMYGPVDGKQGAPQFFFKNLLDWLAQERDLLALQNKIPTDRNMTFLSRDEAGGETVEEFRERAIARQKLIQGISGFGPAVLAVVLGVPCWLSYRVGNTEGFLDERAKLFPGFSGDLVQAIEISRKKTAAQIQSMNLPPDQQFERVIFIRTRDSWRVGSPPKFQGLQLDDEKINQEILDHLATIPNDVTDRVPEDRLTDEFRAQQFLTEETATIIKCKRGTNPTDPLVASLFLGRSTRQGGVEQEDVNGYYVVRPDRLREVVLYEPPAGHVWFLPFEPTDWADREIHAFLLSEVDTFRFENAKGSAGFKRKGAGWEAIPEYCPEGVGVPRAALINNLLDPLRKVTAASFYRQKILSDEQEADIEITVVLKSGEEFQLWVKGDNPQNGERYAVSNRNSFRFGMTRQEVGQFEQDPKGLFDDK